MMLVLSLALAADPPPIRWSSSGNAGQHGQSLVVARDAHDDYRHDARAAALPSAAERCLREHAARTQHNLHVRVCAELRFTGVDGEGRVVGQPTLTPDAPQLSTCIAKIRHLGEPYAEQPAASVTSCFTAHTHYSEAGLAAFRTDPTSFVDDLVRAESPIGTVSVRLGEATAERTAAASRHLEGRRERHRQCYADFLAWWSEAPVELPVRVVVENDRTVGVAASPGGGGDAYLDALRDCISHGAGATEAAETVPAVLAFRPD